jgi:Glycosyl transferase family 11
MIISKISGGLGNQLFQFAAGRSLAIHHNTELCLDISVYQQDGLRNFDLTNFNIKPVIATEQDINKFTNRSFTKRIRDRILPHRFRKLYKEPFFHFDKNFFKASQNTYLKGYWQSEKYFSQINDIIRNDFTPNADITDKLKTLAGDLKTVNSVAIHIRRADYTTNHFNEYHGILGKDYYAAAIQLMKEKKQDCRFYIFSDDIKWVKQNYSSENAVFVSGEIAKTHIEDLYLMSRCHHNIIANSSFSWWGAWLNNNPDKIVISPKKWFNKGPKDTDDLYPDGWIRL